jgi:coiled-coil domain-containing protein 115
MKATRGVLISDKESKMVFQSIDLPGTVSTSVIQDKDEGRFQGASSQKDEVSTEKHVQPKIRDPIHWYGILVPQPLRICQRTFIDAVNDAVPTLSTIMTRIRALEIEIKRKRKMLRKMGAGSSS